MEAAKIRTPNVLTFKLEMGNVRFFVVGCYIAPTDEETVAHVRAAWVEYPKGYQPLLLGNLNASLREPVNPRADSIADAMDEANLVDLAQHFKQRAGNQASET